MRSLPSRRTASPTILGRFGPIAALGLVAIFLLSGATAGALLGHGASGMAGGVPTSHPALSHSHSPGPIGAAAQPRASSSPVANGRGLFFDNHAIPFPNGPGNQTCPFGICVNNSNDPSINLTSTGLLAVANTVYTNISACGNVTQWTESAIGVSVSSNFGGTWSTPTYLGNRDCAHANQYASSWQPSLTSLGNGTLVLAYIEFNLSSTSYYLPFGTCFGGGCYPNTYTVPFAALVLTESYDNGSTWTNPQVLNSSANPGLNASAFAPMRPWVTAFGSTIYVTWMNYTTATMPNYSSYPPTAMGSSQVHLLVSKDGGTTWGTQRDLRVFHASGGLQVAVNPSLLVDPTGRLYVAYATNWSFIYQYPAGCTSTCTYNVWFADLEVATSVNNGTALSYHLVAHVNAVPYRWSNFVDPSPQMAWSQLRHQLFMVWSSSQAQYICPYGYCYTNMEAVDMIANSSNSGATWSPAHLVSKALTSVNGQQEYNPAIAVTSDGVVHLETSYVNLTPSQCLLGYNCPQWELYLNSSDNGATFSPPIIVDQNFSYYPYAPDGEYVSMVSAGTHIWLAWALEVCPSTAACYYPSSQLYSQVTVSQPYRGIGVTVTYQEKGLASGTHWAINMLGNVRGANAPATLSVSGVPPATNVSWNVSSIDAGYGIRYASNASLNPPASFITGTTILENYSKQVLVNVTSNPSFPACNTGGTGPYCWNNTYQIGLNYNITPGPQAYWVFVNQTFSEQVSSAGIYCTGTCYAQWLNLSFQSWTGVGAGSVSSSGRNITFTPTGPVNETANFQVNGYCTDYPWQTPNVQCLLLNQSLMFHESGLPIGQPWNVTIIGAYGTVTASSNTSWLDIQSNATLGVISYAIWTNPTGTPGQYWIGTGNPGSPIQLPGDRVVNVTFARGSPSSGQFWTSFSETGLPNATAWTLDLGSTSLGVQSSVYNTTMPGGSFTVGGEPVYVSNGSAFYATKVTLIPLVRNSSWQNFTTLPATVTLAGPAMILVTYSAEYWVTVAAGPGGTVSPGSQWVHLGQSIRINESALAGNFFVGWTGTGPGSQSTRTPNPTITPQGPVTELATFSPNPLPTYNISVRSTGLPAGAEFTVGIGTGSYSGGPSFTVTGLAAGDYPVSVLTAYDNQSNQTRYLVTAVVTTFVQPSNGVIRVGSDGYLNVTFQTQYLVTVSSTGSGTVTPSTGVTWTDQGAVVSLTATPASGYLLIGWVGSGVGSVSGSSLAISPVASSPIAETAQFGLKPTPPSPTFNLTVGESGLPSGVMWNASLADIGSSGASSALVISGLNGSYTVTVPIVYASPGVRFVPSNGGTYPQSVYQNAWLNVTFVKDYLLTVTSASGGTVSPGSQWVAPGTQVTLTATASGSSWNFANWSGTTTGTGATLTVTVNGPTTETASFTPVYLPQQSSGSSTAGQSTAIGLFLVLLAVALLVGLIVGRRRAPPPTTYEETTVDTGDPEAAEEGSAETSAPEAGSTPLAEYDEGPIDASPAPEYYEGPP